MHERAGAEEDFKCLDYVLDRISRLPKRTDKHILTTEQDMLRHRFMNFVHYLFTGGHGGDSLTTDQVEAVEKIQEKLFGKLLTSHFDRVLTRHKAVAAEDRDEKLKRNIEEQARPREEVERVTGERRGEERQERQSRTAHTQRSSNSGRKGKSKGPMDGYLRS